MVLGRPSGSPCRLFFQEDPLVLAIGPSHANDMMAISPHDVFIEGVRVEVHHQCIARLGWRIASHDPLQAVLGL